MSFSDKLKELFGKAKDSSSDIANKAKDTAGDLADKHGDKVTGAVTKATGFIDEKSGGKSASVTEKVESAVDKTVGKLKSQND